MSELITTEQRRVFQEKWDALETLAEWAFSRNETVTCPKCKDILDDLGWGQSDCPICKGWGRVNVEEIQKAAALTSAFLE